MANFYDLNEPPIVGQSGPLILDRKLQPVWFQPVPEKVVALEPQPADLRRQAGAGLVAGQGHEHGRDRKRRRRRGQPALPGRSHRLKGTDGWVLTLHEFLISGEDAWVTANKNIAMDLSRYGGAYNGALDRLGRAGVQPQDRQAPAQLGRPEAHPAERVAGLAADQRLPLGRLPRQLDRQLRERERSWSRCATPGPPTSWTSARGAIEWTLGGRNSSFKFGPGAALPVAARRAAAVRLDGQPLRRPLLPADRRRHVCVAATGALSRARAEARRTDPHGDPRGAVRNAAKASNADYMGDTQPLPNGNVFIGWGSEPYFSRVQPLRQAAVRRRTTRARPHLQRHARAVGRACL